MHAQQFDRRAAIRKANDALKFGPKYDEVRGKSAVLVIGGAPAGTPKEMVLQMIGDAWKAILEAVPDLRTSSAQAAIESMKRGKRLTK